jgi:NAD(P)-dependent dehydrogenase (short-subunit alcohol dehydrogenase family)
MTTDTTTGTTTGTAYPPRPISDFRGLVAVVTGGGSGMGRELVRQLSAAGCHVATCDVSLDALDETIELARADAPESVRFTTFVCDVSDEDAMLAFADHVADALDTEAINLLFNNAGIGGGGSLVLAPREEWDRVFGVCWGGVINGMRAFLPMLLRAERGHVVNTSSINGLWACLGPVGSHTAYSSAKFAVRGLTEALVVDFRVNAPHLTASVVLPGHIGTGIVRNSMLLAGIDVKDMSDEAVAQVRQNIEARGIDTGGASDEDIRNLTQLRADTFEHGAPTTASVAATIILDAVRAGEWRVLVGEDAHDIDRLLRERPVEAYTDAFMDDLDAMGHFTGLIQR